MSSTPETNWNALIHGDLHKLMLAPSVLSLGFEKLTSAHNLAFYINVPSICWALLTIAILTFVMRKQKLSLHRLTFLALTLTLAPYAWGMFHIKYYQPLPIQIGPIVAFMTLSIMYNLILISIWMCTANTSRNIRKTNL